MKTKPKVRGKGLMKYSASYTNLNPNFCVIGIDTKDGEVSIEDKSIIAVVRNIINRGVLSSPSLYLREMLGRGKKYPSQAYSYENEINDWNITIKGAIDQNPALDFYKNNLLKLLNNDVTLYNSFIPELPISEVILGTEDTVLNEMYLDFYSPILRCNIEIDGIQHREQKQKMSDTERDKLLKAQGINVIRIKVEDIEKENLTIKTLINKVEFDHYIENKFDKTLDNYGAAIRYQMLVLELLDKGIISLSDKKWKFSIKQNDNIDSHIAECAIRDVVTYIDNLLVLQDRKPTSIDLIINETDSDAIKVDLDIYKKYDDALIDKKVIYIRNDYFQYSQEANVQYHKSIPPYGQYKNYYVVSNGENCYQLKTISNEKREALRFFLKNVFHFENFLPKQEEIIFECLRTGCVIGLLPTGAGKSLCYQLSSLMLPGTTLVVSPLKILMKDQYENMVNRHNISNICYINSSNKGATDVIKYNQAKICLISPERFFNEEFLEILRLGIVKTTLVTVDEVHCLSEWGHDFRTSYLCLSHYLRENLDKNCHLMGLTATASPRVCEDVQIEFSNFKGFTKIIQSTSLARKNLDLEVKKFEFKGRENEKNTKYAELLNECKETTNEKTIVFTRTKSTHPYATNSCFNLSYSIKNDIEEIQEKVDYFAGSSDGLDEITENDIKLQNFKDGKTTLLFSTKAFGMGVDIPDIRKTIHYEIPSSLESLYQEFGRAGRDGKKSQCKIWYYEEYENAIKQLFNGDFSIKNIKNCQKQFKEIQTNLFFLTTGNLDTEEELFFENYLFSYLQQNCKGTTFEFTANDFMDSFNSYIGLTYIDDGWGKKIPTISEEFEDKVSLEFNYEEFIDKAMYRLYLIGKISMWGVRYSADLKNPIYVNISVLKPNIDEQIRNLVKYIRKYEPMYEYTKAQKEDSVLRALISWAFNHFVYQRLQSVKNIYEACQEYKDSEQFMDVIVRYLAREEENETLLTNPADYKAWFKLLKEKPMIELKSIIARYLESDDKLVSLNFISGIIRLLTDDYDNADGERRLKMAFEEISRFATNEITEIVREMFNVIPKDKYKDVIVKSILEVDENFAEYLYKEYQNEEIESHIIYNIASKIRDVGGKINDKYRKN